MTYHESPPRAFRPVLSYLHEHLPGHWWFVEVPLDEAGVKIDQVKKPNTGGEDAATTDHAAE